MYEVYTTDIWFFSFNRNQSVYLYRSTRVRRHRRTLSLFTTRIEFIIAILLLLLLLLLCERARKIMYRQKIHFTVYRYSVFIVFILVFIYANVLSRFVSLIY